MGKKIAIGIQNIENLEFKILEKAEPGDYFSLNSINEIDFSDVKKQIENKETNLINEKLKSEKVNWVNEFKANGEYKDLQNKINNLEKENEKLKSELENKVKAVISETKLATQEEISNLKNEIEKYKMSIEHEKLKVADEKNEIIKNLEIKISNAGNEKEIAIQKNNNDWELKLKDQETELLNKYKEKINEIERKREQNVKLIGEDLENWIQNQFDETFGMIDGCKLEKTTKNIGGKKPDFLFSVYDNQSKQTLGKVVIEAKSQKSLTETNKKNKDYFEKLEIDRKNHDSEFAILVSELEPDETFYIKKVPDENYQNMFIVRPQYFIAFLSIVRYIWIKKGDILRKGINFEKKQNILDEFNLFKNQILSNSLKNLETNLDDILKAAEIIEKNAKKIKDKSETVLNTHLNTIRTKIENFRITKIVNDIEKSE